MPSVVCIHDASTIDAIEWPRTVHGEQAKAYLPRMVKEGAQAFVDNAPVRMLALRVVGGGLVRLWAFRRGGCIDAFWADFERDGVMSPLMIGYDLDTPRQAGLYRMTLAMMFREAVRRRSLLNQGAGAGKFKSNRGCAPIIEFDMVYTAHLPPHRRLPWWVLRRGYTESRMKEMSD